MKKIKFRIWDERYKEFRYWGFVDNSCFISIPTGGDISIKDCEERSEQFTGLQEGPILLLILLASLLTLLIP